MEQAHSVGPEQARLFGAVRGVRQRWRLKRALAGASIVVGASFVAVALASFALDALRWNSGAVLALRIACGVIIAGLVARFFVPPFMAPLPDDRVALYLEERERSLDASLLTAVDVEHSATTGSAVRSPALARRLVASALERLSAVNDGRRVDQRALAQHGSLLAMVLVTVIASITLGPAVLRHGVRLLLTPWDSAQPLSLYAIGVQPGDTTIALGGDQLVTANLQGFRASQAQLLVRSADSTTFTPLAMHVEADTGRFTLRLLAVRKPLEYAVVANGVKSRVYRLRVADLPFVKQLTLEYRYPAYTGLAPRKVDEGGDIAAPKGTLVTVHVTPTRATAGGRLVLDGGDTLKLVPTRDGTLLGVMRVARPGFYKAQLQAADGRMLDASLDYNIDVLPDRPPTISFSKPGADTRVLSVDEVYFQVAAEDDYGIQHVELAYSVNGGPEKTLPIFDARAKRMPEVSAAYTLPLENMKLQPGDVVSYYARAVDNDAVDGAHTAATDIYFLQVRPYEQDYRQDQGGGGGGGGPQQDSPGTLVQMQRDIIAGTFKSVRDSAFTPARQRSEDLATLRLAQQKLREMVQTLAQRLVQRGIAAQDTNYRKIAEVLPQAAVQMDSAERRLASADPVGALSPEQRALQQLQRAEAVFRNVRVSMGGQGGGGGGGAQQRAQDLADLFDMNRDKLRNQYETLNRGSAAGDRQQAANNQLDSTMDKLRRLSQRQQQENERAMRKLDSLSAGAASASGGGGDQRDMARQAEETARQLERLAREQSSPQLADAARRLQDASNEMRRAAAERGTGTAGQNALRQLDDARRLLDQQRTAGLQQGFDDALNRARAIQRDEQQVAQGVSALGQPGADQGARAQLQQRKNEMAGRMRDLENRLDQLSDQAKQARSAAASKLDGAAQSAHDRGISDKMRASASRLRFADPQSAKSMENQIADDIGDVVQRMESAAPSIGQRQEQGQANGQRLARSLDRTRELARGLESMQPSSQGQQSSAQGQQSSSQGQQSSSEGQQPSGRGQAGRGGRVPNGGATPLPSPGDPRQIGRALRERIGDAEQLRGELMRQGIDVTQLDRAIAGMRAMTDDRILTDSATLNALRARTLEDLRAFAFVLGRGIQSDEQRVLVGARGGEVPVSYRQAVEAYYRSLSAMKRK